MNEHLPVVLPSLLQIDSQKLLEPERKLDEEVPFQVARDLA